MAALPHSEAAAPALRAAATRGAPMSARSRVSLPAISLACDARRDALTEAACTEHMCHAAHA